MKDRARLDRLQSDHKLDLDVRAQDHMTTDELKSSPWVLELGDFTKAYTESVHLKESSSTKLEFKDAPLHMLCLSVAEVASLYDNAEKNSELLRCEAFASPQQIYQDFLSIASKKSPVTLISFSNRTGCLMLRCDAKAPTPPDEAPNHIEVKDSLVSLDPAQLYDARLLLPFFAEKYGYRLFTSMASLSEFEHTHQFVRTSPLISIVAARSLGEVRPGPLSIDLAG